MAKLFSSNLIGSKIQLPDLESGWGSFQHRMYMASALLANAIFWEDRIDAKTCSGQEINDHCRFMTWVRFWRISVAQTWDDNKNGDILREFVSIALRIHRLSQTQAEGIARTLLTVNHSNEAEVKQCLSDIDKSLPPKSVLVYQDHFGNDKLYFSFSDNKGYNPIKAPHRHEVPKGSTILLIGTSETCDIVLPREIPLSTCRWISTGVQLIHCGWCPEDGFVIDLDIGNVGVFTEFRYDNFVLGPKVSSIMKICRHSIPAGSTGPDMKNREWRRVLGFRPYSTSPVFTHMMFREACRLIIGTVQLDCGNNMIKYDYWLNNGENGPRSDGPHSASGHHLLIQRQSEARTRGIYTELCLHSMDDFDYHCEYGELWLQPRIHHKRYLEFIPPLPPIPFKVKSNFPPGTLLSFSSTGTLIESPLVVISIKVAVPTTTTPKPKPKQQRRATDAKEILLADRKEAISQAMMITTSSSSSITSSVRKWKHYLYHVIPIGNGASGKVFLAYDTIKNKDGIVLKFIPVFGNEEILVQETRAIRHITNLTVEKGVPWPEHVMHVEEIYTHDDHTTTPAWVDDKNNPKNEYVQVQVLKLGCRGTLIEHIRGKPLSPELARTYIYQFLKALRNLHNLGVVHRDLKPDNIFLDNQYGIMIGDLGYAEIISTNGLSKRVSGSRYYKAPELLDKNKCFVEGVDVLKADIWTAGMVCFCMVFGDLPWRIYNKKTIYSSTWFNRWMYSNRDEFWSLHTQYSPPILLGCTNKKSSNTTTDTVNTMLDPRLIDLISSMLEMDPLKRPSANECLAHEYLDGLGYRDHNLANMMITREKYIQSETFRTSKTYEQLRFGEEQRKKNEFPCLDDYTITYRGSHYTPTEDEEKDEDDGKSGVIENNCIFNLKSTCPSLKNTLIDFMSREEKWKNDEIIPSLFIPSEHIGSHLFYSRFQACTIIRILELVGRMLYNIELVIEDSSFDKISFLRPSTISEPLRFNFQVYHAPQGGNKLSFSKAITGSSSSSSSSASFSSSSSSSSPLFSSNVDRDDYTDKDYRVVVCKPGTSSTSPLAMAALNAVVMEHCPTTLFLPFNDDGVIPETYRITPIRPISK